MSRAENLQQLRHAFASPDKESRPAVLLQEESFPRLPEEQSALFSSLRKAGFGSVGILPGKAEDGTTILRGAPFSRIISACRLSGLSYLCFTDPGDPSPSLTGAFVKEHPECAEKMLVMREYQCIGGELNRKRLDPSGITLSVVGYDLDWGTCVDLREELTGDTVVWDTPDGNWNILQFSCVPVPGTDRVDPLDPEACGKLFETVYGPELFGHGSGGDRAVSLLCVDGIRYAAPNRRTWSYRFNEIFFEMFGFDPAPFYPALFLNIGEETDYYTSLFQKCRAKMFADGLPVAFRNFARKYGIPSCGSLFEGKAAASSHLYGDALLALKPFDIPSALMDRAYLYGINGIKPAASSAVNWNRDRVAARLFDSYFCMDSSILFRDAMNALVRGANVLLPVIPGIQKTVRPGTLSKEETEIVSRIPSFTEFTARCQSLLRSGKPVCDVAVLSPVESLHAGVRFYESREDSPYAPTLPFADYISNLSSLLNYCGRDAVLIHPDALSESHSSEGGVLTVGSGENESHYRVLILPAMKLTSLSVLRKVDEFYRAGGKIIATSRIPFRVSDHTPEAQQEAEEILYRLFGVKNGEVNYVSDYEMHTNEAGGMAVYLRSSMTELDGTQMVEAARLNETLWQFDIPVEIIFQHRPRILRSGLLSLNYPSFRNIGAAADGIPSKGVFNYTRRQIGSAQLFYISNTTVKDWTGACLVSGNWTVEEWNPHTGKIQRLSVRHETVGSTPYTSFSGNIPAGRSSFLVCSPASPESLSKETVRRFEDFGDLREFYEKTETDRPAHSAKRHLFQTARPAREEDSDHA
ncbi:MAG: hypothetical protein J5938_00705 [Clostridia bacterium]|nr:hypothetical protein [Clostridia bacterium]